MGSMQMRMRSPAWSVKSDGGTMPVPVMRKHPLGNELSRKRYSTSSFGSRLSSESLTHAGEDAAACRDRSRERSQWIWAAGWRRRGCRAEGAASVVDLGLGQVERVLALDVAGAHVVADGVADDDAAGIDDESEFGLGHGPFCVLADADLVAGADGAAGGGLEEELWALGGVDAVVKIATAGVFGFLHARAAAAVVGDAGGPDFLVVNGREDAIELGRFGGGDCGSESGFEVVVGEELVPAQAIQPKVLRLPLQPRSRCWCDIASYAAPRFSVIMLQQGA